MSINILITGANRGELGQGLLEAYASKPNTNVIAGVREVAKFEKDLSSVKLGAGSKVITVKLDTTSKSDAKEAVEKLKVKYGIEKLDVVIANAGISKNYATVLGSPPEEFLDHFNVNTIGPVLLFQATWPLLDRVEAPKFVVLSSLIGTIGGMEKVPLPAVAYGVSNAAINYVSRKLHFEHEKLIVVTIHPGWVQTEMGNSGAQSVDMTEAPVTLKDGLSGLVSKIDGATPATSGTFFTFDGSEIPW